jgi:hypothetical protein
MKRFIKFLVEKDTLIQHEDRIPTRFPTAVKGDNPHDHTMNVDMDSMKRSPTVFKHNVDLVKNYHALPKALTKGKHEQVAEHFINHVKDNLLFLHDKMKPEVRDRAKKWYDGAHNIMKDRAKKHDIPHASVAGVYGGQVVPDLQQTGPQARSGRNPGQETFGTQRPDP